MPPVRWKLLAVMAIYYTIYEIRYSSCSKMDSMSMAEDGWRPIIGAHQSYNDEITHYRNPASKKTETMRAEKPTKSSISKSSEAMPSPQAPPPKPTAPVNHIGPMSNHGSHHGGKIPPHSKPMLMIPHGGHGPQIPLGSMTHRPMKHGMHPKNYPHMSGKRHKPIRVQMGSYSSRDEVFAQAPSNNIGTYTYYSPGQTSTKTRINQPHGHIEFTNHYPLPNQDDLYQIVRAPVQQYVIPKHPIQNDVHYTFQTQDEFTRNLVPPPFKYMKEKEKQKILKPIEIKEAKPDNVIQLPPPFGQQPHFLQNHHNLRTTSERAIDVQVTKEKLNTFHNNIPQNYNPRDEYDYHTIKTPQEHKLATYEVTEGKHWQETPPYPFHYSTRAPQNSRRPPPPPPQIQLYHVIHPDEAKPFLPTPLKPESALPTLATESEASTIYNQVSYINRQKQEHATPSPSYFSIKDVSTHFPIVGKPDYQPEYQTRFAVTEQAAEIEESTEIATKKYNSHESYESYEDQDITTMRSTTIPNTEYPTRNPQRKRPNQRRRRPTTSRTSTTQEPDEVTNVYEAQRTENSIEDITDRPLRGRRPIRYRTTSEAPMEEEKPTRGRQRRPRPTTTEEPTEMPLNHKEDSYYTKPTYASEETSYMPKITTEKEFPASFESHFNVPNTKYVVEDTTKHEEYETNPSKSYTRPPLRENVQEINEKSSEESLEDEYQTSKTQLIESTTREPIVEPAITTGLHIPENEIDYTTKPYFYSITPEAITEVFTIPETTTRGTTTSTTTTTTTTTTPAPTKTNRVRGRPMKYDNRDRPRFSVKEYRQRMNAISSTTTEATNKLNTDSMRVRFPIRSRRPITTIGHVETEEESTEPIRGKFQPKDPRHASEKAEEVATTEKIIKPVNTRLRPFGRFRSTTEPTSTTLKISIKPNIFSNLRRPTPISLKNRILNKNKIVEKTTMKPTETTIDDDSLEETNETDMSEIVESTLPYNLDDMTTEFGAKQTMELEMTKTKENTDILKNESFMQSQIVSDLTSSAKNDYNIFKNVSPTSRKVPSYFTISTDDPILPIEAFFPNLKQ